MGLRTHFILGFVLGVALLGCTAAVFPYKYYALDADIYTGYLRGEKPADDLELSVCEPTANDKAPCVVLRTETLLKMKLDYKEMQNRLRKCEI